MIAVIVLALFTLPACTTNYDLRGSYKPSADGKTYLIVDDNDGGGCGPIMVDRVVWPHGIGKRGAVQPGIHEIECGHFFDMGIKFEVKTGVVYRFNYWGP